MREPIAAATDDSSDLTRHPLARASGPLGAVRIPDEHETFEGDGRYRLLFERNPQPMWVYDTETLDFLAVNEAAVREYGYTRPEFLRMTVLDIRPPEEIPRFLQQHPSSGDRIYFARWRHKRKDGTILDAEVTSDDITFASRPARLVVALDITERLRAEAALREREARFRSLWEAPMIGLLFWDVEGQVTDANDTFLRLIGYSRDDLERGAIDWRQLTAPEYTHRDRRAMAEVAETGVCEPYEKEYVRKDGSRVPVLIGRAGFPGAPTSGAAFVLDLTERKRLERLIERSEEQLRQAQKLEAVGRLAGGIAHDFTNLLTAVKSYTAILLDAIAPTDPRHEDVAAIKRAVDRAASLTSQLLAFSRRRAVEPRLLDLNTVVVEMEAMLRPLLGTGINLALNLSPTMVGPVLADPDQLGQVIMNLALNARDAMPDGGRLTIETSNVELPAPGVDVDLPSGMYGVLTVRDTGVGMDEATRERIFEPFFTTKEPGKGTGLGLAMVYGIVTGAGGHIMVESAPGVGTTFRLFFPWEHAGTAAEREAARATLAGSGETLLLVEDDDEVRAIARRVLNECGYNVLEARNGSSALRLYGQHARTIRLLVTDVVMPDISGRQLAERLTRRRNDLHVLFISGHPRDELVRRGLTHSPAHYLAKPFTPAELLKAVRKTLGR